MLKRYYWVVFKYLRQICLLLKYISIYALALRCLELLCCDVHCVKSVRIRSYSGLYFPAFGLNLIPLNKLSLLRILTGKKHRQVKLQRLQKLGIWAIGSLVHQINSS